MLCQKSLDERALSKTRSACDQYQFPRSGPRLLEASVENFEVFLTLEQVHTQIG
jgi:hypothetical protein